MKLRKTRHPLDKQSREKSVALLNDFLVLAIDLRLRLGLPPRGMARR